MIYRKNYQQGISLIEMITIISIILILSIVSYPAISRYAPHYRLLGANRELISILRYTQSEAVTKQYIYITRFTTNNYSIIKKDGDEGPEETQGTINLPRGISISVINLADNQVAFTASGSPSNSGTIRLTNNLGEYITIEITPSGQIRSY